MSIQVQVNKGQAAVVLSAAKWEKLCALMERLPQGKLRDEFMNKAEAAAHSPAE